MAPSYQRPGLTLARGAAEQALVKDLQRDLRRLGYLRAGIDGVFGDGTERAVRALQYDLRNNHGESTAGDGTRAPVAIADYNRGRVAALTGALDQNLATCIAELIADVAVPKLPNSADPARANREAMAAMRRAAHTNAPAPFLAAIIEQESGAKHFAEPEGADEDNFVVVGLDRKGDGDAITSRGYGVTQQTLFHHPPTAREVRDLMSDPAANIAMAFAHLREKFDGFVLGKSPGTQADDRLAEHPAPGLRLCRYAAGDARYLLDCGNCAREVRTVDVRPGTPVYAGAKLTFAEAQYYAAADYTGVPDRAAFQCDWPYAARRYNGSGLNSYHYQARVLLNLLHAPADDVRAGPGV